MTWAELIYKLAEFFWSSFWYYTGLIFLIMILRGDVLRGLYAVKTFFVKVKERYVKRVAEKASERFINRQMPKDLTNVQRAKEGKG